MAISGRITAIALALTFWMCPSVSWGDDAYSFGTKGYLSGYAASGDRKLDDEHGLSGSNAGVQAWFRTPAELSMYFDARYFGAGNRPENRLREAYLNWDAGKLNVRAGKEIIVWGRADRFNPTDVITPRNYEVLSFDDDDQRFGVEGMQGTYHVADAYSVIAVALPSFRSGTVPSGALPPGIIVSTEHEKYSSANAHWGLKLDRTGEALDWSVCYYRGFSTLPEVVLTNTMEPVLENRRIWMAGADFAASVGAWGLRGEAAYIDFEVQPLLSELYPHSYVYSVLGVERSLAETMTLNVQWLHRTIRDFTDPQTITGPFGQVALGNALIHNQFDKQQDGFSLSLRDKWLHETLTAELSGVYFIERHDYLIKPKLQYALTDQWQVSLLAELYQGPENSFFGGLRKNSLVYAELRYQFGPFEKK
jgi:hypothetical protein